MFCDHTSTVYDSNATAGTPKNFMPTHRTIVMQNCGLYAGNIAHAQPYNIVQLLLHLLTTTIRIYSYTKCRPIENNVFVVANEMLLSVNARRLFENPDGKITITYVTIARV